MQVKTTGCWKWAVLAIAVVCLSILRGAAVTLPLVFDADSKEYSAKQGELEAHFTFSVTNTATTNIVVTKVETSCGCTVAKLPSQPWPLAPGESGNIEFTIDLRGKSGLLTKSATVTSTAGFKVLLLKVQALAQPAPIAVSGDRAKNIMLAIGDRQAVFKNDCARCHLVPSMDKHGEALYQVACAICHDSPHRASMVPDLHALKHPTDAAFWKQWIKSGKPGSLMPAFSQPEGGPLTELQITTLAEYLTTSTNFPSNKLTAPATLNSTPGAAK